jgi:hypothetical protein
MLLFKQKFGNCAERPTRVAVPPDGDELERLPLRDICRLIVKQQDRDAEGNNGIQYPF